MNDTPAKKCKATTAEIGAPPLVLNGCLFTLLYLRHLSRPTRTNPETKGEHLTDCTLSVLLLYSAMLLQLQLQSAPLTSQHCGTRSATQQTNFDLSFLLHAHSHTLTLFLSRSLAHSCSPPLSASHLLSVVFSLALSNISTHHILSLPDSCRGTPPPPPLCCLSPPYITTTLQRGGCVLAVCAQNTGVALCSDRLSQRPSGGLCQ